MYGLSSRKPTKHKIEVRTIKIKKISAMIKKILIKGLIHTWPPILVTFGHLDTSTYSFIILTPELG